MSSMLTRFRSRVTGTPLPEDDAPPAETPTERAAALRAAITLPTPPAGDTPTYATDSCLHRYLRARNNDVPKATKMLNATLQWRARYRPDNLAARRLASLRFESSSGKMFVLPQADSARRACIVMRTGLENSRDAVGKIAYLVYTLERAAAVARAAGGEQFVVISDYSVGEISTGTLPSISVMRETTNILQGHYPERLACMIMVKAPKLFYSMFTIIRPLIDVKTREKIHFVDAPADVAAVEGMDGGALPKEYGGEVDWSFDVDTYFEGEGVADSGSGSDRST